MDSLSSSTAASSQRVPHSPCHVDVKMIAFSAFFITTLVLSILCYQPQASLKGLSAGMFSVQVVGLVAILFLHKKGEPTDWKKVAALVTVVVVCLIAAILGSAQTISAKALGGITMAACCIVGGFALADSMQDLRSESVDLKINWLADIQAFLFDRTFIPFFQRETNLKAAMEHATADNAGELVAEFQIKSRLADPNTAAFFAKNGALRASWSGVSAPYSSHLARLISEAEKTDGWKAANDAFMAYHPAYKQIADRRNPVSAAQAPSNPSGPIPLRPLSSATASVTFAAPPPPNPFGQAPPSTARPGTFAAPPLSSAAWGSGAPSPFPPNRLDSAAAGGAPPASGPRWGDSKLDP